MNNGFNRDKSLKIHSTPQEAFKCYSQHLERTGHEKISSREFRLPEGGILVLTKPSRYGGKLRKGKNDLKGSSGARFMPDSVGHSTKGGVVIG